MTRIGAVTLLMDYCSACHQEVYKNRPSHVGYGFEICASAGCHNFHDNTALYEDFLVKHAGGPEVKDMPVLSLVSVRWTRPRLFRRRMRWPLPVLPQGSGQDFPRGASRHALPPKAAETAQGAQEGDVEAYLDQATGGVFRDHPLEAMQVADAQLTTLKPDAGNLEIGNCNACHKPHEVDLTVAARGRVHGLPR